MAQYPEFKPGKWQDAIDVRDFIQNNYTPYEGDASFLVGPTARTQKVNAEYEKLHKEEFEKGGVLDVDVENASSLLNHKPGYLDRENEIIVGLQTDAPLKRSVNPFGGMRMAVQAAEAYGYHISEKLKTEFTYRTTHNDGVFRAYTKDMRALRSAHVLTGLPDAYGRGRIIGDYRRVALYGVDRLIEEKQKDLDNIGTAPDAVMDDETIRLREDVWRQIDYLDRLKKMAEMYGCDISKPAQTAKEAVQATYFAYLAAIKEQNGAAMSLGRTATFLDIYIERDIQAGILTEETAPAHEPPAPHPGVQRALRRRPHLDHRVPRRHGPRWPHARHQDHFPRAPHAREPRPRARAEHDRPLGPGSAPGLEGLLRPRLHRHRLRAVRERRPHARALRRRLRHRLLRLRHDHRQGHAVLRRPRQPPQGPPHGPQRRPRGNQGQAGRPQD